MKFRKLVGTSVMDHKVEYASFKFRGIEAMPVSWMASDRLGPR